MENLWLAPESAPPQKELTSSGRKIHIVENLLSKERGNLSAEPD